MSEPVRDPAHLRCPYCQSYDVTRLFLGSLRLDSCDCRNCGARWDEDSATGEFRGRASRASVVVPRRSSHEQRRPLRPN